jgi:integrase
MRLSDVTTVGKLPKPETGNKVYYDGDGGVPGFGVRVTSGGHRAFILNYRTKGGRERRYTIGDAGGEGGWTVGAARIKARELRRLIDDGRDPLGDVQAEREAPTMADLIERFDQEHVGRLRPGTQVDYRCMLKVHVAPAFRSLKVADVTLADVERLHTKITKAGHLHRANRVTLLLSKMFSLAARWGYRDTNPCKGTERNHEPKRKRYLVDDELARLVKALNEHPDQSAANVFRLLLLCGARRGEVLAMRWADVDLTRGTWTKPASTTKQKREHESFLSTPARQLLSEIREQQSSGRKPLGEFVFPGNGSAKHVVNVNRVWRALTKAAKIDELRIHDLRHSFASQLVSSGASLPLIGALLGHSNPATTARYAHLFADPQREAVETVGAAIMAAGHDGPPPRKPALTVVRPGRR